MGAAASTRGGLPDRAHGTTWAAGLKLTASEAFRSPLTRAKDSFKEKLMSQKDVLIRAHALRLASAAAAAEPQMTALLQSIAKECVWGRGAVDAREERGYKLRFQEKGNTQASQEGWQHEST